MDGDCSVFCKFGSTLFSHFNSSLISRNPISYMIFTFAMASPKAALVPF
jgi:hypothetical protein